MKYLGDHWEQFISESKVLKGTVFNQDDCLFKMRVDDDLSEIFVNMLDGGQGDYISWQGEQLSICGGFITSDHRKSKLASYLGINLRKRAASLSNAMLKSVDIFLKIKDLNQMLPFGDVMTSLSEFDFLKGVATDAVKVFILAARDAFEHALISKHAFNFDADELIEQLNKNYVRRPKWYDTDWVKETFDLQALLNNFVDKIQVEKLNSAYCSLKAAIFTYSFCNKRNFNTFVRFDFSSIENSEYETEKSFNSSVNAISLALVHQEELKAADEISQLKLKELLRLPYGESQVLDQGIKITRRKDKIEICLPHSLAEQLQFFVLKYNRESVQRYVA